MPPSIPACPRYGQVEQTVVHTSPLYKAILAAYSRSRAALSWHITRRRHTLVEYTDNNDPTVKWTKSSFTRRYAAPTPIADTDSLKTKQLLFGSLLHGAPLASMAVDEITRCPEKSLQYSIGICLTNFVRHNSYSASA